MPATVNGLPAHVLLLHAVVVLLPIAAVMTVLGAVWPAARRRMGIVTPVLAFVVLALVPVTTKAGEWLRNRLDPNRTNPAIDRHATLGHGLLPWALGIFLLALTVWVLDRRYTVALRPAADPGLAVHEPGLDGQPGAFGGGGTATLTRTPTKQLLPVWVTAVVAGLTVVVAVGATIELYRIGDSGAHAAWDYVQKLPARG